MQGFFSTLPYSRTLRQLGSIACAALFLAACSSGGGDGGGGTPPAATPTTGTFVDSPVDGLRYTTTSNPGGGFTSGGGHFQCQPGDSVTFWIGTKQIGNAQPCSSDVVTAVSVLGASSVTSLEVVNLAQLLMTLAGPDNVSSTLLTIPQPLPSGFKSDLVPAFTDLSFDTDVLKAFPAGTTLVSNEAAILHLQPSLKMLTVTVINGGMVTSTPAGINNCTSLSGTCSAAFQIGTVVTLTATGSGFSGWSDSTGSVNCPVTGTCSITLNADTSVTATFPLVPPPSTLSVTMSGDGRVTSTPAGIDCGISCSAQFPGGTLVTLTATADPGSTFTGWSKGTGSVSCPGTGTCPVILNADSTVTATFTLIVTQFSVTATPASANTGGGMVQCSANGGAPGSCGSYPVGTTISIIPTPNSASNFTSWTNGTGSVTASCSSATGPCDFVLNQDTSITANFNRPTLTVVVNGTGSVSSTPAGIDTCTTNCSAPFDKGAVTLTASITGFTGWSGGCSGTVPTCLVTLTADTTVTTLVSTATGSIFPLTSDPTSRYLVDQNGVPFPILGRTAWFITSLSVADYQTFIDDTAAKGYNAIEFHVVNHDARGNNPPFDGNGALPFTNRLDGLAWAGLLFYGDINNEAPDFSQPNETYWMHIDALLAYAESKGVLCFMFPAYAGGKGGAEGWMAEMTANGASKMTAFGAFLAARYKTHRNIVWMLGGDYGTGAYNFTAPQLVVEKSMLAGMQSVAGQLSTHFSAEWSDPSIYTDQADATLLAAGTLEGAYSFEGDVNTYARIGYAHSPAMPTFLLEEPYDEEGPDGNRVNPNATQPVRRFQWWGWLSGIGGYISGNGYIWPFNSGVWTSHLNTQGARDMARLNAFIRSIAWYNLVPSGLGVGTLVIGNSSPSSSDYVAAAATLDGTLLVAYVPPAYLGPTITIDMTAMSGPTRARWFNPTTAAYVDAVPGLLPKGTPMQDFTPPAGSHGDIFTDWVLLLEKQ